MPSTNPIDRWTSRAVILTIWTSVAPVAYLFQVGSFGVVPYEIFEGLAGVGWTWRSLQRRSRLAWPPGAIWLVLFMLLTGVSAIGTSDHRGAFVLMMRNALSWFMIWLLPSVVTDRRQLVGLLKALLAQAIVLIVVVVLCGEARFGLPALAGVMSNQFQKNDYATYLAFALALAIAARIARPLPAALSIAGSVVVVLAVVSWPLTYSRGGLVAMVVTLVLMAAFEHRRRMTAEVLGVAALAVTVWLAMPSEVRRVSGAAIVSMGRSAQGPDDEVSTALAQTVNERMVLDRAALETIRQHPWRGVGLGEWQWHSPLPNRVWDPKSKRPITVGAAIHNRYLYIAAESGVLTLAAYLLFLGSVFRSVLRLRAAVDPWMRVFLGALMACTVGLLVALLFATGSLWEWTQMAVLVTTERVARRELAARGMHE
jgi:O-antigen ligase